jgi:hypothetical protein
MSDPLLANRRAQRSASCELARRQAKAESGHLDSAVDIAATPLIQPPEIDRN